jgi:hypothetical protein
LDVDLLRFDGSIANAERRPHVVAIDYIASGNAMFGTAPIGYEAWLVALAFAAAMLLLEEARKAFVRRRERVAFVVPDTSAKEPAATSSG